MALLPIMKKRKAQEPFAETTFECRRGDLTIRGTEYKPEGADLPVAIVCHGFMAWQDTVRHYARELARMGYCAYCFDFCCLLTHGPSEQYYTAFFHLITHKQRPPESAK